MNCFNLHPFSKSIIFQLNKFQPSQQFLKLTTIINGCDIQKNDLKARGKTGERNDETYH